MKNALRPLTAFLFLATGAVAPAGNFFDPGQFKFTNDVHYVPGGGNVGGVRRQSFDIYEPVGATGPLPVLLLIHGGGWNTGSGDSYLAAGKDFLATGDYVVAAMNYRLNTVVEPLLTQVDDVKAAIRHLRANAATFGIDPVKIGLYGNSAGAHLASMAGLSSDVPFFGLASDLANQQNLGTSSSVVFVVDWSGPAVPPGPPIFDLAPYASPGDPAFKLFHSVGDLTVSVQIARDFRDALVAGGVSANMVEIPGSNHFPQQSDYNIVAPQFLSFINAQYAAAPEPGSAFLFLLGGAMLGGCRRRGR